jgi:secondary thiamine-phosphate synthase enzyme
MSNAFDRIAPEGNFYKHDDEGADDMPAHIKSTVSGVSINIPISNGKLAVGTWQGVYLMEYRSK